VYNSASKEALMRTSEMDKEQRIEEVRKLVEATFRCLVDAPDAVIVRAVVGSHAVIFEVSMEEADKGRALGTRGAYKRSLEELLRPIAGNHGFRYIVDRIE